MPAEPEIRIALPSKGALEVATSAFLAECGIKVNRKNPRQYLASIKSMPDLGVVFINMVPSRTISYILPNNFGHRKTKLNHTCVPCWVHSHYPWRKAASLVFQVLRRIIHVRIYNQEESSTYQIWSVPVRSASELYRSSHDGWWRTLGTSHQGELDY